MKHIKKIIPILISVVILSCFLPTQIYADGEGWLTDYGYRKQFTITGSSDGILSNYQLKVTVNRSTGADSGLTVYVGTKCEADYDDIRFTKADGSSLLDYWIESATSSTALIWVEFDSIPASPSTINFYMYYGYASAIAVSSGTNTFILFDDFSDNSLSATWTGDGATESGTVVSILGDTGGSSVVSASSYNLENRRIKSKAMVTSGKTTDTYNMLVVTATTDFSDTTKGWRQLVVIDAADNTKYLADEMFGGSETFTASSVSQDSGTYHNFEIIRKPAGSSMLIDGTSVKTSTNDPGVNEYIYVLRTYSTTSSYGLTCDWIFMSQWTINEPTVTSWAAEETPYPTVTTSAASNVTMDSAGATGGTFNGEIANLGGDTGVMASFQYGLTTSYGSETSAVAYNSTTTFDEMIPADLLPGNTYYYRSKATNSYGTSYGSAANFTFTMPTFSTDDAIYTSPGSASATLCGNITNMGAASNATVYFQWGYNASYGTNTADQLKAAIADITQAISGFMRNVTIHFRTVVEVGSNTTYGSDETFLIAPEDLVEVLLYQPVDIISGTTMPDRDTSDGAQDGVITWGTNPSGVTVVIGPFGEGVGGGHEAKAPMYELGDPGDFITGPPAPAGNFSSNTIPQTWWGFNIWEDITSVTTTPIQFALLIVSGFIILVLSLASSWIMRRFGSGSHFVKGGLVFGCMGVCIALGLYDWWMGLIFAVIALALSWMSQQRGATN